MTLLPPQDDSGLRWLDGSGPHSEVVLSTRVRLARNLQGAAFGSRARPQDREATLARVRSVLDSAELLSAASIREIPNLSRRGAHLLLERRLISRELVGGGEEAPAGTAVILGKDESLSVMINEEDHLRLQCLVSGLRLPDAWARVDRLDDELGGLLPFAFHPEFGFLTSCPTNAGTGLRASVLMHLPGLVLTKEIHKVLHAISQLGLTFRGLWGEGSDVVGSFFQVSNQTTLGKSEEDLVGKLDQVVRQVIHHEMQARAALLRDASQSTEDKVWRGYGLLRFARSLSFDELMNVLSLVRLGVGLKLLPGLQVFTLNRILMFAQPAHLEEAAGRDLSQPERDLFRASLVRGILESEGRVLPDPPRSPEGPPR